MKSARPAGSSSAETIPAALRTRIRRALLGWYDRNRRDLPWRRRRGDAYAQWVAEIMLQQTRVETVIPFYERFLQWFPTVASLATADHEDVLKHWQGLGYYRRALHLHRATQLLHQQGRDVPSEVDELKELPGVGDYVAGAIASIAYDRRCPAVDGNVCRVLARLFVVTDDVLTPKGRARITELAGELVPRNRAGDFNQACMDLGSLVCTPKGPKCDECPLLGHCRAASGGMADHLPIRGAARRRGVPVMNVLVGVFTRGRRVLLCQRPTGGLWSGLWELPNRPLSGPEVTSRDLRELLSERGIRVALPAADLGVLDHRLTHRQVRFHIRAARVVSGSANVLDADRRWVDADEFADLPLSTAHRRVADRANLVPSLRMKSAT